MARKDDLKLLFNFIIELLKDEKETNTVIEQPSKDKVSNTNTESITKKQDEFAKRVLSVMKHTELMDKMKSTTSPSPKVILSSLRDYDDHDKIAQSDREIIDAYESEKKNK